MVRFTTLVSGCLPSRLTDFLPFGDTLIRLISALIDEVPLAGFLSVLFSVLFLTFLLDCLIENFHDGDGSMFTGYLFAPFLGGNGPPTLWCVFLILL